MENMERKPRYKRIRKPGEALTVDHIKAQCAVTESGCWEWQRFRETKGYGRVQYGGRVRRAHIVAFLLSGGAIPPKHEVMHSCDNPPCCNPEHLSAGTHQQNMADMITKGRGRKLFGEDHYSATITADTALQIWHAEGSLRKIAARFGVTSGIVFDIRSRDTWRHLTEGLAREDGRAAI